MILNNKTEIKNNNINKETRNIAEILDHQCYVSESLLITLVWALHEFSVQKRLNHPVTNISKEVRHNKNSNLRKYEVGWHYIQEEQDEKSPLSKDLCISVK